MFMQMKMIIYIEVREIWLDFDILLPFVHHAPLEE